MRKNEETIKHFPKGTHSYEILCRTRKPEVTLRCAFRKDEESGVGKAVGIDLVSCWLIKWLSDVRFLVESVGLLCA